MKTQWIECFKQISIFFFLLFPIQALANLPRNHSIKCLVLLAPNLGDWMSEMGIDMGNVCGVTQFSKNRKWAQGKKIVGSYSRLNIEKILVLNPDLVLATKDGNSPVQIQNLKKFKLNVMIFDSNSIQSIFKSVRKLGKLFSKMKNAEDWIKQFENGIEKIRIKLKGYQWSRVLLQVGHRPLIVAGEKTFISDIFNQIKYKNIFHNQPRRYFRPRLETVLKNKPDFIFIFLTNPGQKIEISRYWEKFGFKNSKKNIYFLEDDRFLRPSLGFLKVMDKWVNEKRENFE